MRLTREQKAENKRLRTESNARIEAAQAETRKVVATGILSRLRRSLET